MYKLCKSLGKMFLVSSNIRDSDLAALLTQSQHASAAATQGSAVYLAN